MHRQVHSVFPLVMLLVGLLPIFAACDSDTHVQPEATSEAQIRRPIATVSLAFLTPAPKPTVTPAIASTQAHIIPGTSTSMSETARLTLGAVAGAPGEQVTLPIFLDSGGKAVRSVQVNVSYDGEKLTSPVGEKGAELLAPWSFTSHSPNPGDLRFLAFNLAGNSESFDDVIFTATFTIDANVPPGEVPVRVALEDVRDDSNLVLNLTVVAGAVTVTE